MPESKKRKRGNSRPVSSDDELRPSWNEGVKASPRWFAPLAFSLMGIGLVWIVLFYILAQIGIMLLGIGNWNLAVGFTAIMSGFIMLMWWR